MAENPASVPYRVKKNETVPAAVRRIALEQIESALANLAKASEDTETSVHEARKDFKKARALLRLVRDDLGEARYAIENAAFRDAGRKLATVRDGLVRVHALETVASALGDRAPLSAIRTWRRRLRSRYRGAARRLTRGQALPSITRMLEEARARVPDWTLAREGFDAFASGLERTYGQGRKRCERALEERTPEELHAWRRRAKDLRYHVDLLHPVWPELMGDLEKTLHELTDRLGDDHDLAELRRTLSPAEGTTDAADLVSVLDELDRRRAELQQAARPLGHRIYSEKQKAFVRRIEGYWTAWRSGSE
jgi:CHAD domain-containing protein